MKSSRSIVKLAAALLVLLPTAAHANPIQSGVQSVSSSTVANGAGAVATSQTHQSLHQSANTAYPSSQMIIQDANVNTAALGDHAAAATQLNQTANQNLWHTGHGDWIDVYNQMMLQQANMGNYAIGDWSQAVSTVEQMSDQYFGGY